MNLFVLMFTGDDNMTQVALWVRNRAKLGAEKKRLSQNVICCGGSGLEAKTNCNARHPLVTLLIKVVIIGFILVLLPSFPIFYLSYNMLQKPA